MRRAKNIKEESRYYFTQGVLQHNCRAYADSIASLQKFLKIVLFIRDEKSVELALNSIGAEYMTLGDPQSIDPPMQPHYNSIANRPLPARARITSSATQTAASVSKWLVTTNRLWPSTRRRSGR